MINLASKIDKDVKFLIFGGGFSGKHFAGELRKIGYKALTSYRNNKLEDDSFFFDSDSKIQSEKDFLPGV